jgi:type-F conjugative transfer system pilin assembly protein TrbC
MLRKGNSMMKRLVLLMALALASAAQVASAQSAAGQAAPSEEQPAADRGYIPYGNLEKASAADIERAQKLGISVANDLLEAYKTQATPEMAQFGMQQKRRADDIANETLAADRDKVLEFLGLDPQADTALYYFVSWSMPIEMLRSYAIEAMWSGGTMLFKGVPPGKELGDFILHDLQSLVYGKGASANISIDPRLFDAYEVKTVPTIVFSTVRNNMSCQGVNPVSFKAHDQDLSYDTCPAIDPSKYSKISGAVTTNYALQTFIDDGLDSAKPYLKALARGWVNGNVPDKTQKPFAGKWESVLSPSEKMAAQEMADVLTRPAPAPAGSGASASPSPSAHK